MSLPLILTLRSVPVHFVFHWHKTPHCGILSIIKRCSRCLLMIVGAVRITKTGRAHQIIPAHKPRWPRRKVRYGRSSGRRMLSAKIEDVGDRVVFLREITNGRRRVVVFLLRCRRRFRRIRNEHVVHHVAGGGCPISAGGADARVAPPFHLVDVVRRRRLWLVAIVVRIAVVVVVVVVRLRILTVLRYDWAIYI